MTQPKKAVTVWKDGTWKSWSAQDAYCAQSEAEWLVTIPLEEANADAEEVKR